MVIKLYKNYSEKNRVNKELVDETIKAGTLREDNTSIVDPIILIAGGKEILEFNYAYIPEFDRYYYFVDTPIIVNGIVNISLHTDVLMSKKDEWLQNSGYVDASKNYGNFYLMDRNTPIQQNTHLTNVKSFDGPFGGSSIVMSCLNIGHPVPEETEA